MGLRTTYTYIYNNECKTQIHPFIYSIGMCVHLCYASLTGKFNMKSGNVLRGLCEVVRKHGCVLRLL